LRLIYIEIVRKYPVKLLQYKCGVIIEVVLIIGMAILQGSSEYEIEGKGQYANSGISISAHI